jgi:hypothetical protein
MSPKNSDLFTVRSYGIPAPNDTENIDLNDETEPNFGGSEP